MSVDGVGGEMGRIIVVGDILTDVVALVHGSIAHGTDTPASITMTGGGAGANTAAWLATIGMPVTLCGVVGADPAGDARAAELVVLGVDCSVRISMDAPTGTVLVFTGADERSMLTDRGANLTLTPADVDDAFADAAGAVHLHLSGYALLDAASRPAAVHALRTAAARGLTTSVDAASAGPLRHAGGSKILELVRGTDVLFANTPEAEALLDTDGEPDDLARALANWCGTAVVKLGKTGALSVTAAGDHAEIAASPATTRDVTGAGDAFAAGFLAAWLTGTRGAGALHAGAELGAQAVESIGARPPEDP